MITHVVRFYKIQVLLSKNFVISIRNSNFSRLYFGADKKELWSDESISSNAPLKSHLERERTRSREQNSNCNRDLLLFRVCECVRRKQRSSGGKCRRRFPFTKEILALEQRAVVASSSSECFSFNQSTVAVRLVKEAGKAFNCVEPWLSKKVVNEVFLTGQLTT